MAKRKMHRAKPEPEADTPEPGTPEAKAAKHDANMAAIATDPNADPHPSPGQSNGIPSPGEGPMPRDGGEEIAEE